MQMYQMKMSSNPWNRSNSNSTISNASLLQLGKRLPHILEEQQSSHQSVCYILSNLASVCSALQTESHVRQAELCTMATECGRAIRVQILQKYGQISHHIIKGIEQLRKIQVHVGVSANDIKAVLKQIEYYEKEKQSYWNFIQGKMERIDKQINRLSELGEQIQKQGYLKRLQQCYNFRIDKFKVNTSQKQNINENKIPAIAQKIQQKIVQHRQLLQFAEKQFKRNQQLKLSIENKLKGIFQDLKYGNPNNRNDNANEMTVNMAEANRQEVNTEKLLRQSCQKMGYGQNKRIINPKFSIYSPMSNKISQQSQRNQRSTPLRIDQSSPVLRSPANNNFDRMGPNIGAQVFNSPKPLISLNRSESRERSEKGSACLNIINESTSPVYKPMQNENFETNNTVHQYRNGLKSITHLKSNVRYMGNMNVNGKKI